MLGEEEKHPRMSLVMGIHRYAEHLMTETKDLSSRDFDFFFFLIITRTEASLSCVQLL